MEERKSYRNLLWDKRSQYVKFKMAVIIIIEHCHVWPYKLVKYPFSEQLY